MKHLYRSQHDRVIAGVCGGLGIYFHSDPLVFRLLFILLAAAGGIAVPLYLLLWLAMPPAREVFSVREQALQQATGEDRSRTKPLNEQPAFEPADEGGRGRMAGDALVLVGVVFVGLGLALLFRNLGLLALLRVLAPVALVVLGIALLIDNAKRKI
jgi:phage shock protein C